MAKRSRSTNITQEDVMFAVLGAAGGMAVNSVLNKALESQPQNTKDTVGKVLPAIKLIGGGYLAMNKKTDRNLRFAALGVAGTGAVELGAKFAPDYFAIGNSDIFEVIGNTDLTTLNVLPSGDYGDDMELDEGLLGVQTMSYATENVI